ncbi:MAG: lamin tail domain-containing protein, partial [Bacteroidales bacterium]|nr:lamin tail domain-containing protein [Bacteroidales bacterium]
HATKPDHNDQWPNPPWSTLILRTLLENQSFRDRFVQRSFDLLNNDFTGERVSHELDILVSETEGEIRNHMRRWDHGSYGEWEDWVKDLRNWSKYRASRVRIHIRDFFDLGEIRTLSLDCNPPGGGQVQVNSRRVKLFPWEGDYVEDYPVALKAVPAYGYRFAGWDGVGDSDSAISVSLDQPLDLTARFEPGSWYEPIVINEINYHSAPEYDAEDWVELYNNGSESVDLSNWVVKDSEDVHAYRLPQSQSLGPGEYLVVSRERNLFSLVHPEVQNVIGDMGFGFGGGGELVRLFNPSQELIDWVEYDDFTPWPLEPDGTGATLALSHPDLDNADAQSWFASVAGGTPGFENGASGHTGIQHELLGEIKVQ